ASMSSSPVVASSRPPATQILPRSLHRRSSDLLDADRGDYPDPAPAAAAAGDQRDRCDPAYQPWTGTPRGGRCRRRGPRRGALLEDRKSTRLNSSHQIISYAVFCLKKKKSTPTP